MAARRIVIENNSSAVVGRGIYIVGYPSPNIGYTIMEITGYTTGDWTMTFVNGLSDLSSKISYDKSTHMLTNNSGNLIVVSPLDWDNSISKMGGS